MCKDKDISKQVQKLRVKNTTKNTAELIFSITVFLVL